MLPSNLANRTLEVGLRSYRPKSRISTKLSFNVNRLRRAGALIPGRVGDWQWTQDAVSFAGIGIQAETGRIVLLYRFLDTSGTSEDTREVIRVVRCRSLFGDGRILFLCPGRWGDVPRNRAVANLDVGGCP